MAEEVIKRIIRLQEDIRGTDETVLRDKVYVCVANACILLNSYIMYQILYIIMLSMHKSIFIDFFKN